MRAALKKPAIIQNLPCTLVTGFLGAGKTTVINQLLAIKPIDERWALLINEFGRIGIDGALLTNGQGGQNQGSQNQDNQNQISSIAIREVSGGCICCTSQLPLQIAISRLLSDHHPQRLLIEPTGLAHPRELIRQLSAPHWQTALSMQAVITVLSGVQWQQEKYRTHDGFQAHVRDADVLVINRYAQLSADEQRALQDWIARLNTQVTIIWAASECPATADNTNLLNVYLSALSAQLSAPSQTISQQRTANNIKSQPSRTSLQPPNSLISGSASATGERMADIAADPKLPYRYHETQQDVLLAGWRLPPDYVFQADDLQTWLLKLPNWQRIKGIVHTSNGWIQLNFTPNSLTTSATSAQTDSRLEIILQRHNPHKDTETDSAVKNSKRAVHKNHHPSPLVDWDIYDRELMALIV